MPSRNRYPKSEDPGSRAGRSRGGGRVEAGGLRVAEAGKGVVKRVVEETSSDADGGGLLACEDAVEAALDELIIVCNGDAARVCACARADSRGARVAAGRCTWLMNGEWTRAMRSPREAVCIRKWPACL